MRIPKTTKEHYLTGQAALNIPGEGTTGDWHFPDYFRGYPGREPGPFPIAGVDTFPTTPVLGSYGVADVAKVLQSHGAKGVPSTVYAASHYRAYIDLLVHSTIKFGQCRAFPYADWFGDDDAEKMQPFLIDASKLLPDDSGRELVSWFKSQLPRTGWHRNELPEARN